MRRSNVGFAVGLSLLLASTPVGGVAAQPDPNDKDAGEVVVVDPFNVTRELNSGDSASVFSLRLPEGAACQRDSANDDWRVQSFLVPVGTDIGALRYKATRPDGERYRSLRYPDGDIFVMEFTNPNPGPGQPGTIPAVPALTMAYFEAGSIPPGEYVLGIACTNPGWYVERFWDVDVRLEAAPEVETGGLRWQVIQKPAQVSSQSSTSSTAPLLALSFAFVAVVGGLWFLRRRSRPPSPLSQKEKV